MAKENGSKDRTGHALFVVDSDSRGNGPGGRGDRVGRGRGRRSEGRGGQQQQQHQHHFQGSGRIWHGAWRSQHWGTGPKDAAARGEDMQEVVCREIG